MHCRHIVAKVTNHGHNHQLPAPSSACAEAKEAKALPRKTVADATLSGTRMMKLFKRYKNYNLKLCERP
jgi:hypothetical protein